MRCANFVVKKPMIISHECAGFVEEVGSEAKSLKVGDRVALEPGISCQSCDLCKNGRYSPCLPMKFLAPLQLMVGKLGARYSMSGEIGIERDDKVDVIGKFRYRNTWPLCNYISTFPSS